MTAEARSAALRQDADVVLAQLRLHELCADIGTLMPTGSYFLDLMMWPDLDLYLPPTTPAALLQLGAKVAQFDCVTKLVFERGGPGDLKDGLYLAPQVQMGDWGHPWKIDIWSLPLSIIEKKQARLIELKQRMTDEQRLCILETKQRLLTPAGRTPMFSGFYIYQAVIEQGMHEFDEIVGFLTANGIRVG